MSDVLSSQGLTCGICDCDGVVAAALRDMLEHVLQGRDVRLRMLRCESPQQMDQLVHTHRLGLAVWVLSSEDQLPGLCQAITAIRDRQRDTLCVCFLNLPRSEWVSLLTEAGVQLIVGDLATLQVALPRLMSHAPLSAQGYHPLTSGLLERLPWGHV